MKKLLSLAILLSFFQVSAFAKQLEFTTINHEQSESNLAEMDERYYTISEVVVTEVEGVHEYSQENSNKSLGEVIVSLNKLIAFGKKVWKIVEAGKPVSNVNIKDKVSVLPKVENPQDAFYDMENWKAPMSKKYKVEYKNLYGMSVVSFVYTVHFEYGGQYKGKGAYLTNVGVEADTVSVMWGYEFDAINNVQAITNRGTLENPVAAVTMKITYEAKSVLRTIKSSEAFSVSGAGEILKL